MLSTMYNNILCFKSEEEVTIRGGDNEYVHWKNSSLVNKFTGVYPSRKYNNNCCGQKSAVLTMFSVTK